MFKLSPPPLAAADSLDVDVRPRERNLSWLMSAVLHMVLFLAFAILWHDQPHGTSAEPDRGGGIVLVQPARGAPEYFSPSDSANAANESAAANAATASSPSTSAALPGAESSPVDVAAALPKSAGLAGFAGGGDALPNAAALTGGRGPGKPVGEFGGKTHTYVFGAAGSGNTFVYVFDRSASMEGFQGRPIAAAKRELIKSLQHLESTNQFQIIFYNDRTTVFNPRAPQNARLLFGDESNKRAAERFVGSIVANGGTRHLEPLKMALSLSPDVIFFLTDADEPQLTTTELNAVSQLNERVGATINAIQFGAGPFQGDDNFLVKLARRNNGQHVYVDVTALPRE